MEKFKKKVEWIADWIEPSQKDGIAEPPLTLEQALNPDASFYTGAERILPVKEIQFKFFAKKGSKVIFHASAHGVYNFTINGKKSCDARLAPETTNYNKLIYFQTYDVSELIKDGSNTLSVLLGDGWYRGRLGLSAMGCEYGNRLAFIGQFEIRNEDGTSQVIAVDESARSRDSFICYSDLHIGEKWDLTAKKGSFKCCKKIDAPKNILKPQPIPAITFLKELPVKEIIITPKKELVLDFGQVFAGVTKLDIKTDKQVQITLDHSEVLDKDGNFFNNIMGRNKNQQDVIVCSKDSTFCPIFTYHGFRYVRVSASSDKKKYSLSALKKLIKNAVGCVVGTPLEKTGYFNTDNDLINSLQSAIEWSSISNMVSVPTDCPQREKLGWTGDINAFKDTGIFLYDLNDFLGAWLDQLRLDQEPNGDIPVVSPNHPTQNIMQLGMGNGSASSAAWSDVCVMLPLALYKVYGKKSILSKNYTMMKRWLSYIESTDWRKHFHFGDWLIPSLRDLPMGVEEGREATAEITGMCYKALVLKAMCDVCSVLDKKEDLKKYKTLHNKTLKQIRKDYVNEDGSIGTKKLQGLYVLVIKSGALDKDADLKQKVIGKLVSMIKKNHYCLDTGFASVPHLLDVLYDNGFEDIAYKILFQEQAPGWLYMVTHGATTIWENWTAIKPDGTVTDSSFNHYAFGCIGDWMYRHIAGINITGAGCSKVKISPDVNNKILTKYIKKCSASFNSINGQIIVNWSIENGEPMIEYSVPNNVIVEH